MSDLRQELIDRCVRAREATRVLAREHRASKDAALKAAAAALQEHSGEIVAANAADRRTAWRRAWARRCSTG